jgi:hypothetical protein
VGVKEKLAKVPEILAGNTIYRLDTENGQILRRQIGEYQFAVWKKVDARKMKDAWLRLAENVWKDEEAQFTKLEYLKVIRKLANLASAKEDMWEYVRDGILEAIHDLVCLESEFGVGD